MNNITQTIKTLILATILSFGISFAYAWTVPTVAPTGGNTAAPLNTSGVEQTKLGNIISSGNIGANAMAISNAAAGALQVVGGATFGGTLSSGAITATTGTFSGQVKSNNADVLTVESDPAVSAWAKAASKPTYTQNEIGSGALTATTGTFSGNVGIGTPTPGAKLSVMDTISGITTGLNISPFYVPPLTVTNCIYTGNPSNWCGGMSRYTLQSYTIPAYGGTELNATDSGGTARNLVLQTGTGNVGIGTGAKNPTYKLQVDGSLYVAGAAVIGSGSTLTVNGATTLAGGVSGNLNVTGNVTTTSGYYISGGVYGGTNGGVATEYMSPNYFNNAACTVSYASQGLNYMMYYAGFTSWGVGTLTTIPVYYKNASNVCTYWKNFALATCQAGFTVRRSSHGDTLCIRN